LVATDLVLDVVRPFEPRTVLFVRKLTDVQVVVEKFLDPDIEIRAEVNIGKNFSVLVSFVGLLFALVATRPKNFF
jgi:hypothetical protein